MAGAFHASAEAYDRHVGRYGGELASALIAAAGICVGMRALDVGSGTGALTRRLARLLGAEKVAAVDPAESFVETCRARVGSADVRMGVAEELPFDDGEFDAVLAQLVLNHMSDPVRGVQEMRRVARPGGVVVACVWDFAEGMQMLRAFWEAALLLDPIGAVESGAGNTPPFCHPGELRELWVKSGLTRVEVGELVVGAEYADFEDYWWPFAAGAGGSGKYCASLDRQRQTALREEVDRRLGFPAGAFRLTARAWYAYGRSAGRA